MKRAVGILLAVALAASPVILSAPANAVETVKKPGASCSQAKKAVKVAKTPAAKKKAKRVVKRACGKRVLPAGAVGYNADGSVRYGAEAFQDGTLKGSALAKAVDGVSGENWEDQSGKPVAERVGFPPGLEPSAWLRENLTGSDIASLFQRLNAQPGEEFSRGSYAKTGPSVIKGDLFITPVIQRDGTSGVMILGRGGNGAVKYWGPSGSGGGVDDIVPLDGGGFLDKKTNITSW